MIAAFGREHFGQNEEKMAEVVERLYWCNGQKMRVFVRSSYVVAVMMLFLAPSFRM